jgi:hypothetical protein
MLAGTVGLAVDLTQRAAAVKPHIPGYESRGAQCVPQSQPRWFSFTC